jgi:hypothetical protein
MGSKLINNKRKLSIPSVTFSFNFGSVGFPLEDGIIADIRQRGESLLANDFDNVFPTSNFHVNFDDV